MAFKIHHPQRRRVMGLQFVASGTTTHDAQDLQGMLLAPSWSNYGTILPVIPDVLTGKIIWRIYFDLRDLQNINPNGDVTLLIRRSPPDRTELGDVTNLRIDSGHYGVGFTFPGPGEDEHCSACFSPYGTLSGPDATLLWARLMISSSEYARDIAPYVNGSFWSAAFYNIANGSYTLEAKGSAPAAPVPCSVAPLNISSIHCP